MFCSCSLQNDYAPPQWLPLLEVVLRRISDGDEESSILFQLLSSIVEGGDENVGVHIPSIVLSLVGAISKLMPANLEPWPQVCVNYLASLLVCTILDLLVVCSTDLLITAWQPYMKIKISFTKERNI